MPRSPAANEQIRASQRAGILAAARTVFARRGLTATIDEVAAAAGVSHGLAYRYFASKAELFRALAEDALTQRPPAGPGAADMTATPGERLGQVLRIMMANRRDHPETFQLLQHVLTDPSAPRDLLVLAQRRGAEFQDRLRALIVQGQATGEVTGDDPDQLVTAIAACLDGLGRIARPGAGASFPAAEIVLRMVLTTPQPAARGNTGEELPR
jgi:AcrR family transcriptional regulator